MAVAFDAFGSSVTDISSNTGSSAVLTVGSGANRALVVLIAYNSDAIINTSTSTVTWGGTAVPFVGNVFSATGTAGACIYALANPASGALTLAIDMLGASNPNEIHFIGVSFTGANQTTPVKNFTSAQDQVNTIATLSVTSAVGDIPVGVFTQGASNINSTNGTTIGISNAGPTLSLGSNYGVGAATVSMTCTGAASATWEIAGADVAAAGGGVTPKYKRLDVRLRR